MSRAALLLPAAVLVLAAEAVAEGPVFPIYEIPRCAEPNVHDGTLADWADVVPGPSLTDLDFDTWPYEGYHNPANLTFQCYLGWHRDAQTLWIGLQRVDDVYVNTYAGGEPQNLWMQDGIELLVDGDHSGGDYNGFLEEDLGAEMAKLLMGYQAQQYSMIPESPDGLTIYSNTAASGWATDLPWADAGGAAWGSSPTTSVIEGYVTPWDALDWHGPDVSTGSTLSAGRTIGFQISVPDWDDVVGAYTGFYTVLGLGNAWRMAANFVDGELVPCEGCGGEYGPYPSWQASCGTSAVQPQSWARIKASLR